MSRNNQKHQKHPLLLTALAPTRTMESVMPVQRKRKRPIAPAPFPGLLAPASRALQYHVKNPHQRTNTGISGRNELLISDWAQARSPIMKRTLLPFLGCVLLAGCST